MKIKLFYFLPILFVFNLGLAQNDLIFDTTFGTNGIVNPATNGINAIEFATVKMLNGGKFLTYGPTTRNDLHAVPWRLAKYNSDGSIDATFGNSGYVNISSSPSPDNVSDYTNLIKVLSDGKILIVKTLDVMPPYYVDHDIRVSRYNQNGTLDTSFGVNGEYSYGGNSGYIYGVGLETQSDNKILVYGLHNNDFVVFRLNTNGALDQSFADNGKYLGIFRPTNPFYRYNSACSLKVLSTGKILIAGYDRAISGSDYDICAMRLNNNGTIDTTFGVNGRFNYTSGVAEYFETMQLMPDNKLVFFYHTITNYPESLNNCYMIKVTANGQIDTSFGVSGTVSAPFSQIARFTNATIDASGKIVCVGWGYDPNGLGYRYWTTLCRFNSNGTPDNTFNNFTAYLQLPESVGGSSLNIQPDGKILTGGNTLSRFKWGTLASESFVGKLFSVHPNPFTESITIESKEIDLVNATVELYDINGRKLSDYQLNGASASVQINNDLAKGTYLLKLTSGAKFETIKLIKQ